MNALVLPATRDITTQTTARMATVRATVTPIPQLQRRTPRHRRRVIAFYAPTSGLLALTTTAQRSLTLPDTAAGALLAFCASLPAVERPRVVFLCGAAPDVAWWREPLAQGWSLDRWHNAVDQRTGVYSRNGLTIDLRLAAPWFGSTGHATDPLLCLDAWEKLRRGVRFTFNADPLGDGIELLTTPGMTGTDLFEASLAANVRIPTLPDALRAEIRAFTTQGRIELLPGSGTIRDAYQLDAVWQYAACLHNLPMGPVQRDAVPEFAGYTPGFYRVRATVPGTWAHIGLLPHREHDGAMTYPRRPGQVFTTWATGAEVQLALAEGWRVRIQERILWPQTGKSGNTDPAKLWIGKLRGLRQTLLAQQTPVSLLAAGAVRHLALDTVGRFASVAREEHGILPLARINELPAGAIPHIERGSVLWMRPAQIDPKLLRFAHPEWSAQVWGRARARLAREALTYPFDSLIALRTDAFWTTALPPVAVTERSVARQWELPPGTWRIKTALIDQHIAWPQNERALRALVALAEEGH